MTTSRWLGPGALWLLSAVGFVLVSASCGMRPAATSPVQQPGSTALIFGVVEASPGCPVERPNRACQPRVLGGVRVEARPLSAGTTATIRTGTGGRYSFRVAKGRYVLVAATGQVVRTVLASSSRSHHRRPFMPTSVAIAAFADTARPTSTPMVRPGSPRIHTRSLGR
jgi:hypothetical protein